MNLCAFRGRLTADPEEKMIQHLDKTIINFSIAIDRRWSKNREEKITDFIPVKIWPKNTYIMDHFRKGDMVEVVGRLQIDKGKGEHEGKLFPYILCYQAEKIFNTEKKVIEEECPI